MQILLPDLLSNSSITHKRNFIGKVDFDKKNQRDIINKFINIKDPNNKLLNALQMCDNTIFRVDIARFEYSVIFKGKELSLGLHSLSRGESLIAICEMANDTETDIVISSEITQLDNETLLKFLKRYKSSQYLSIIAPRKNTYDILNSLLNS